MMLRKALPTIIVSSLIFMLGVVFVILSFNFPSYAGLYPRVIGIVLLLVSSLVVILDLVRALRGQEGSKGSGLAMEFDYDYGVPASEVGKRYRKAVLWILALCAGIWLLGFKVAVPVFVGAYVAVRARPRWFVTAGAVALTVFFLFYFDFFLQAFWPEGYLKQFLPWLP